MQIRAIGSETSRPPRFSQFKYDKITKEINGYSKTFYKKTSQLVHTEEEFCEIIRKGKTLGFKDELIIDLTLKSYRVAKPKTFQQVIHFMDKYYEFLNTRNSVPFCFDYNVPTHFNGFKSYVINVLKKYKLDESLDEFQISGSALYQDIVPDLDLSSYIMSGKLKNIYIESGNLYIKNKTSFFASLIKRHKPEMAFKIINEFEEFYKPLRNAKGDLVKIKAIPVTQMKSNLIIRSEKTGNNLKFYTLSEDIYKIQYDNAIKPILNEGGKFKIDFNIFVKGGNGRRLQPDLTIKID